jgi:hypothetical protein
MIRRRIALAYWVIALALFIPSAVYAYIDPATTTYIIQIITALVVTVGVSLSVFLYRFRMISARIKYGLYGLFSRRGASAVKSKQETPAVYHLPPYAIAGTPEPPSEEDMAALGEPTDLNLAPSKGKTVIEPGKRNYAGRLKAAIPVSLSVSLSFILLGCMDLALQNSGDMPFKPGAILPTILLVTGVCFAVILFVLPLFRGKVYGIIVSIAVAVLIAGYIQGNFMNGALGELNGEAIHWEQYLPQAILSVAVWLATLACLFLLLRFAKNAWRGLIFFAPLLLIVVQAVAFTTVLNEYTTAGVQSFWQGAEETLTIDGLHTPVQGKNAIVFVLDRLDDDFCDEIEVNHPGFFEDELDGFTRFDDNISYFSSTFPAVAGILTGNRYVYDRSMHDYLEYAWKNADFMHEMKDRGVSIRLFMDRGYAYDSADQIRDIAGNVFKGEIDVRKRVALVKLLKLSAFRYAPMPAKSIFWLAPTEFGDTITLTDATATYLTNDFGFYDNIVTYGLQPSDEELGFFYYHLLGAHGPLNMDENLQWVEEATRVEQATGCFKIVFEYIHQLKALGLYEDATIIITGDHGDFLGDQIHKPMHTALFVKPSGSADTPLAFSHAPVSPAQLPGTIMEGLFGDDGGFGSTYLDIEEGADMTRELDVNLWRYEIKGDGRDFANWSFLGYFSDEWQ